jgi:hypothetical protein
MAQCARASCSIKRESQSEEKVHNWRGGRDRVGMWVGLFFDGSNGFGCDFA